MRTVLLAGGLGTRLAEETATVPKPMIEIGGHPILWHIMSIFAGQGFHEFVVAVGCKGEVVKDYFLNFTSRRSNVTVRLATGEVKVHEASHPDWTIHIVDTGPTTQTGGRLKRISSWLDPGETFMLTYGDGVADIDLEALLAFHRGHGRLATVTAVRPPGRFGSLEMEGDRVRAFAEKPQAGEGWINGGFFVLEPAVLEMIAGDETLWELEPLETLAARGELMAYRHEGFWQPMDTLRDKRYLEDLWQGGKAPWKVWKMTSWAGRSVLVTGASGLVGSWLTPRLVALGADVSVLVRDWDPQSELIRTGVVNRCRVISGRLEDVTDVERALVEYEVDSVFHLGAQALVGAALRSPLATFESNIRGTYHLLEACRRQSDRVRRVVIASSDKAYGESSVLPYTEEMPANGKHPYDVSKSCTDLLAQCYGVTYGLPVAVARCGNIYGGGDLNWSRIVPGTIRSVFAGERPILRSDGTYVRDYLYIEDVVDAYIALADGLERPGVASEAFNFSPEKPLTVLEITRALLRLLEREDLEPVILDAAKAEIRDQYLDSSKAERVLGWKARWSLDAGLTETIGWYRKYLGTTA